MLARPKCPVIALEEHYWDKELAAQFVGGEGVRDPDMLKRVFPLDIAAFLAYHDPQFDFPIHFSSVLRNDQIIIWSGE